jgi:hypothetical protein
MKLNIVNTNKVISSLALIAMLSGFNTKDVDPKASFVQVASKESRMLYTYVEEFAEEAQKRGIEVDKASLASIDLVADTTGSPERLGDCQSNYGVKRIKVVLVITPRFYDSLRNIVFHELGHCLLDLDYSANPKDIMYHQINDLSLTHWEKSLDRLFASYKPEEGLREIFSLKFF